MVSIKNLQQANEVLGTFIGSAEKRYTLNRMTRLMKYLGNPQNSFKSVHVAGTSGKTSTSYYVASLLQAAGYKVGLTVSPHITGPNERVQINLVPLEESQFCVLLTEFIDTVDESGIKPSYFELLIAFAFWSFRKLDVDYAVIEVGLGGLLDSTNVIEREDKICVITDIGLDHTDILGKTIEEITPQKAGIIHQHNTVFMNRQSDIVDNIVKEKCREVNAKLNIIEETDLGLPLPSFQNRNFGLAKATVDSILDSNKRPLPSSDQVTLASQVLIPARMEIFNIDGKKVIVDGSHNPQKIGSLVEAIRREFSGTNVSIMASFGKNKLPSVQDSLKILNEISDDIILTKFNYEQDDIRVAMVDNDLAAIARKAGFSKVTVNHDAEMAFNNLLKKPSELCLIVGSFYLASQVRPLILARS